MRIYATSLYLALVLNMYAVLVAMLLLVATLFFKGKGAAHRMLTRFRFVAGLPFALVILGTRSGAPGGPERASNLACMQPCSPSCRAFPT